MTIWKRGLGDWARGWRRLRDGARRAQSIGDLPKRDAASLFNAGALVALALVLLLALFDGPIALGFRKSDPNLRGLFGAFTDIAKSDWILVASAALGLTLIPLIGRSSGRRRAVAGAWTGLCTFAFVAVAGSGIAANVVKVLVGRGRPRMINLEGTFTLAPLTIDPSYASFPSGHATTAFALAAVLALFAPRFRIGVFAIATMLALSRVVVGAHYLSDILAGGALGTVTVYALADALHRRGLVFAVRDGHLTPKAPRVLLWPLRRMIHRELRS